MIHELYHTPVRGEISYNLEYNPLFRRRPAKNRILVRIKYMKTTNLVIFFALGLEIPAARELIRSCGDKV